MNKNLLLLTFTLTQFTCNALQLTDPKDIRAIELLEEMTQRPYPIKHITKPLEELSLVESEEHINALLKYWMQISNRTTNVQLVTPRIYKIFSDDRRTLEKHCRDVIGQQDYQPRFGFDLDSGKLDASASPETWAEWCSINGINEPRPQSYTLYKSIRERNIENSRLPRWMARILY